MCAYAYRPAPAYRTYLAKAQGSLPRGELHGVSAPYAYQPWAYRTYTVWHDRLLLPPRARRHPANCLPPPAPHAPLRSARVHYFRLPR
eukprot:scaffold21846_cov82-Phaeocystis_antarctica.AAC.1